MWGWIRHIFHPIRHILLAKSLIHGAARLYQNMLIWSFSPFLLVNLTNS